MKRIFETIGIVLTGLITAFIIGAFLWSLSHATPKEQDELIDQLMMLGD